MDVDKLVNEYNQGMQLEKKIVIINFPRKGRKIETPPLSYLILPHDWI